MALKINGYEANYNNILIYDGENIIFQTCRPNDINLELFEIDIRNARKINFSKGDCFETKSNEKSDSYFRNGKDLYVPASIFELVSKVEKLAFNTNGEKNYKDTYTFKLNCKAYKYNQHFEKITDLPEKMPLIEYDPNGKFGSGYSKNFNMYDTATNYKTGETYVMKRWLTYDTVNELVIDCDYYTRTEKSPERLEREKIANILTSCVYSGKTISHYEVEKMLEKVNITIKQ